MQHQQPISSSRTRRTLILGVAALVFVAVLIALLPANRPIPLQAQGSIEATPTILPSPVGNGGKAQWTINSNEFTSNFPQGFDFTIDAQSSAGQIVSATAYWRHTPSQIKRADLKVDSSGPITASWHPTLGDSVPQWVQVEHWWVLKDEKGNFYETDHKVDLYEDNTHNWKQAESEDVIVYWEEGIPDQVGQDTLDAMKKRREFYRQNWGKLLDYRPRVIIYADFQSFDEWDLGIDPPTNGSPTIVGLTSPEWGGTAQVYIKKYGTKGVAYGTVLHEVGHLYQFATGGTTGLPGWLYEGDASYFELIPDYDYVQRARDMAAEGRLPTLQGAGPAIFGQNARDGYDIGYAFFRWLAETYGKGAHLQLWTLLARGKTSTQALETVTGKKFVDMEIDFRTWLGAKNPIPPTLFPTRTPEPTEPYDFPPTPTYEPTSTPSS